MLKRAFYMHWGALRAQRRAICNIKQRCQFERTTTLCTSTTLSQFVMINQFRRRCKCVCVRLLYDQMCSYVHITRPRGPMDKASARNCRLDLCRGHIHPHNLSQSKVANEGTCVIYTVTPMLAFTREQVDPSTHFVPELCSFCDRPGRT